MCIGYKVDSNPTTYHTILLGLYLASPIRGAPCDRNAVFAGALTVHEASYAASEAKPTHFYASLASYAADERSRGVQLLNAGD